MVDPSREDLYFFDPDTLMPLAARHATAYRSAAPFPHVVLDDFLPPDVAQRLLTEFPGPDFAGYRKPDNAFQVEKLGRLQDSKFHGVPGFIRHVLNELNGLVFLDFLEALTGIQGLIGDAHFDGGALHQILPGGKLAVHADFNKDTRRALDRRLNALLYLNPEWRDDYGGHLELWDSTMSRCERKIAPLFNRCVIFDTSTTSYHGHPDPLRCPPGTTRKSIATYYYTSAARIDPQDVHSTLWQHRPDEPGIDLRSKAKGLVRRTVRKTLRRFGI